MPVEPSVRPVWVRTTAVARAIGVSHVTVWRWAVDRKIPAVRPGGPGAWLLVDINYLMVQMGWPLKPVGWKPKGKR